MRIGRRIREALVERNRTGLIKSYLARRPRCSGLPVYVVIEATNRCNLDCVMCPRSEMERPLGAMDLAFFKEIVDQLKFSADFAYLHFFGESLLNEHILDMIDYCTSKGLNTGLSSNVVPLRREMSRALLASKLSLLVLSCDGFDHDTYARARKGASFSTVLENMQAFKAEKARAGKGGPKTVIQAIRFQDVTGDYQAEYDKFWGDYGADNVFIKDFFPWAYQSDKVNKYAPVRKQSCDSAEHVCVEPWRGMAIYWDGRVVPCCNDYSGKHVLGDLKHQTIGQVWNGKEYSGFRKMHASGNLTGSDLCRRCSFPIETRRTCRQKTSFFRPSTSELLYYGVEA